MPVTVDPVVIRGLKLGTPSLRTGDDFLKAIQSAGMMGSSKPSQWATMLLRDKSFETLQGEEETDLVVVSPAQLGFATFARRDLIYSRAMEKLGVLLCPAELGPQLRLQYPQQPRGEALITAMEHTLELEGSPNVPYLFGVTHDAGLVLHAIALNVADEWHPLTHFVFRKKARKTRKSRVEKTK